MEEKINIAEILKDKAEGTKLYSPICGECKLSYVESAKSEPQISTESDAFGVFYFWDDGKAWDAEKKQIVDLKTKVELRPFDRVLVRDSKSDNWRANLFGYIGKDGYCHCVYANWAYCIPYEGNELLLGTSKDVEG